FMGLILLVIASKYYSEVFKSSDDAFKFKEIAMITLILAVIIMALGFLGCCAAFHESSIMLIVFSTLMSLIFATLFLLAMSIFVLQSQLMRQKILDSFRDVDIGQQSAVSVMLAFKCCGFDGPPSKRTSFPPACCGYTDGRNCLLTNAYTIDCPNAIIKQLFYVGIAIIILLCFILPGIILASCLAAKIRETVKFEQR
ncbi:hypothetical protein Ciccas_012800, partial [Cichlidogyrus casuarinus]